MAATYGYSTSERRAANKARSQKRGCHCHARCIIRCDADPRGVPHRGVFRLSKWPPDEFRADVRTIDDSASGYSEYGHVEPRRVCRKCSTDEQSQRCKWLGAPPSTNGAAPPNWNSPSIFGGSAPPPTNGTAWNPNQPPNAYGAQGSIFDQAPPNQQQGVFDSFAGPSNGNYGGSFNPGSTARGYESPNSSFAAAIPSYSANRPGPSEATGGSWWDRLTGTKSTVPAAGTPGWNQPTPQSAPNAGMAWNDPRNPSFQRQPIPNPNMPAGNGWNITAAPNSTIPNPLNTAPNYTNYGSPPPSSMPNSIGRTLPASNPAQPTNTLPASWPVSGAAPAASTPPVSTAPWIKSIEDLPPAR